MGPYVYGVPLGFFLDTLIQFYRQLSGDERLSGDVRLLELNHPPSSTLLGLSTPLLGTTPSPPISAPLVVFMLLQMQQWWGLQTFPSETVPMLFSVPGIVPQTSHTCVVPAPRNPHSSGGLGQTSKCEICQIALTCLMPKALK